MSVVQLAAAFACIGSAAVFVLLLPAYFVNIAMLLSRIKRVLPQTYEALGRPGVFPRRQGPSIRPFLRDRDYIGLSDQRTIELAERCRTLDTTLFILMGAMFGAFLVLQATFWLMSR